MRIVIYLRYRRWLTSGRYVENRGKDVLEDLPPRPRLTPQASFSDNNFHLFPPTIPNQHDKFGWLSAIDIDMELMRIVGDGRRMEIEWSCGAGCKGRVKNKEEGDDESLESPLFLRRPSDVNNARTFSQECTVPTAIDLGHLRQPRRIVFSRPPPSKNKKTSEIRAVFEGTELLCGWERFSAGHVIEQKAMSHLPTLYILRISHDHPRIQGQRTMFYSVGNSRRTAVPAIRIESLSHRLDGAHSEN
ncbi:hypothetical protein D9757_001097 [Collybiopsis confluens]|uniref:Uncharacterized protein n=1 Tax=Collybiopsis confluens TaxID=2823264 RepID=A0A8H5I145_9AGAR|nr:hypothetical protein D9757_001097 [Collybiopsis confluens]